MPGVVNAESAWALGGDALLAESGEAHAEVEFRSQALRLGFRLANVWCRLIGGIEAFVHAPAHVVDIAERSGMATVVHERSGRIWRIAVFERAS